MRAIKELPKSSSLKMATAMFAKTLKNPEHSKRHIPESQSHTLHAADKCVNNSVNEYGYLTLASGLHS
jgi:hypothetical protein